MKRIVTTALAVASALAVAQVEARPAGISAKLRSDRIDIAYVEPKSAANQAVYKLLKEHRVLEKIRELLRPLRASGHDQAKGMGERGVIPDCRHPRACSGQTATHQRTTEQDK